MAALFSAAATDYSSSYTGLPVEMQRPALPTIPSREVEITDFGAIPDGITLNTDAFSHAIAYLDSLGGGRLNIGEGVWITGPITLRSNIEIHTSRNALIVFSPDRTLYPVNPPDKGTTSRNVTAPINADGCHDIAITGQGLFDGNGEEWRPVKKIKFGEWEWRKITSKGGHLSDDGSIWYPASPSVEQGQKRPRLLRLVDCERILLKGVIFQNSPSFHVNMFMCRDIVIDGISVRCPWNAQNGDGIDLSSCQRALIVDTSVDCGDDAICMKSGRGDDGRHRGPTTDIMVHRSTVFHGHGGFVIGSDEAGGMARLCVRDCRFIDTDTGLRFKSGRDRGGVVEDIWIDNVMMNDIEGECILFDMYYQEKPDLTGDTPPAPLSPDTPLFRNFHISNIVCREAGRAILINGLPEQRIKDITITGCSIQATRGVQINEADSISIHDLRLCIEKGPVISVNNSSDISVTDLDASGADTTPQLTGSRLGKVRVGNKSLDK